MRKGKIMSIREKIREEAEAKLDESLEDIRKVTVEAANELGCGMEDLLKALLPRSASVRKKLVRNALDKLEEEIIAKYQGDNNGK